LFGSLTVLLAERTVNWGISKRNELQIFRRKNKERTI